MVLCARRLFSYNVEMIHSFSRISVFLFCTTLPLVVNGQERIPDQLKRELERLSSEAIRARALAAERIEKMGNRAIPAIPHLVSLLDDVYLAGQHSRAGPSAPGYFAGRILAHLGEPAIPALVEALRHPVDNRRANAVWLLSGMRSPQSLEVIKQATGDPAASVRALAQEQLAGYRDAHEVLDTLLAGLMDREATVRHAAASGLAPVIALSNDLTSRVNNDARLRAVRSLTQVLLEDADAAVRRAAARSLGISEVSDAVDPLIQALDHSDRMLHHAAAEALGQIGNRRATPALLRKLREAEEREAYSFANALGELADPLATIPLIDLLVSDNPMNRRSAARSLGQIGDRRAVAELIKALDDEDGLAAAEAATALGKMADSLAVMPLVKQLDRGRDGQTKVAAALALGNFNDVRAIRPLIAALFSVKDSHTRLQNAAIDSLKRIRHPDVIAILAQRAIAEPSAGGAIMARQAVAELTGHGVSLAYQAEEFQRWWMKNERLYRDLK